jgi:hypothetical protein
MTGIFLFRWRHKDGSIIEFSEQGWNSNDPKKRRWLIRMSGLFSSSPALTPRIKTWLTNNCHLLESTGPRIVAPLSSQNIDLKTEIGTRMSLQEEANAPTS